MRILLVHNPKAGSEEHEGEDFIKALKRAGHKATYQSSKKKGITKALEKKVDLTLVAGGDGTVSKVARRLIAMDSEVPLAVLPLGTANNFARSLGFCLSEKELIERLNDGRCDTFDVGLARGAWGKRYFFEGAGAGLFADYLRAPKRGESTSKAEVMRRHVKELRRRLQTYRVRQWEIEVDGDDLSGRYLLWHAMNIRSVGPVLTLAADANTNDGTFDFVAALALPLIGDEEGDNLNDLLGNRSRNQGLNRCVAWTAAAKRMDRMKGREAFLCVPGHVAAFVSYGAPRKHVSPRGCCICAYSIANEHHP